MKLLCLLCSLAGVCAGRTVSADDYPSLAAAVSAARSGAVISLREGYRTVLRSGLTIAGTDVTLRCGEKAAIVKDFDGDAIAITGRNIAIEGCTLDGRNHAGGLVTMNGARGVSIRNSILFNTAGLAIGIYHSSGVKVVDSTISDNLGSAVFAQDDLDDIEIASNRIDSAARTPSSGTDTVAVHTYRRGGTATNISIHNNTIRHGGNNFAIEIGAFGAGAVPPSGVNVADNTITLAVKSNGAISFSTLNNGAATGNVIDADRNPMYITAIELVSTKNVTVSHNTFKNGPPGTAYTMSIDGGRNNRLIANRFEGGIYVGTSREDASHVDDNVIEGNVLSPPNGSGFSRGLIWLQCNTRNCSLSRNNIRGNVLNGSGAPVAVNLENDYAGRGGRMDGNRVSGNQMRDVRQRTNIGDGVTNTVTDDVR